MVTACELEHDHATLDRDQCIARRVTKSPNLHIPTAGRISDVDRIGKQRSGIVSLSQLGSDPVETVILHASMIHLLSPQGRSHGSLHQSSAGWTEQMSPIFK
jgi:hypothetical protein